MSVPVEQIRIAEALLFAAAEPLDVESLSAQLPEGTDVPAVLAAVVAEYATRGVNLIEIGGRWSFRTAPDLRHVLERHITQPRKLSRAAIETLAIVAYHQPVTRAEIEAIRGVAISKGTLDVLFEAGWVRLRGRKRTPGRPVMYGTSDQFLEHFGLESLTTLPGIEELKAAGLLRAEPPAPFGPPGGAHSVADAEEDDDTDHSVVPLHAENTKVTDATDADDDSDDDLDDEDDTPEETASSVVTLPTR